RRAVLVHQIALVRRDSYWTVLCETIFAVWSRAGELAALSMQAAVFCIGASGLVGPFALLVWGKSELPGARTIPKTIHPARSTRRRNEDRLQARFLGRIAIRDAALKSFFKPVPFGNR